MRNIAPRDTSELEAIEQREWLDSLDYVIQQGDRGRVQRLLATLRHRARMAGVSLPFTAVTDSVDRYLPPDSLKALFGAAGLEPGNALVAYCNTGRTASPIYVVAKLLGYDVRLYDGSFEEWSRRLDLPVEMKAVE